MTCDSVQAAPTYTPGVHTGTFIDGGNMLMDGTGTAVLAYNDTTSGLIVNGTLTYPLPSPTVVPIQMVVTVVNSTTIEFRISFPQGLYIDDEVESGTLTWTQQNFPLSGSGTEINTSRSGTLGTATVSIAN